MKVIEKNGYKFTFEKSGCINIIEMFENGNFIGSFRNEDNKICNYIYIRIREHNECNDEFINCLHLIYSAYLNDSDCYSDTHKDCYCYRPRYSVDEWKTIVNKTREVVERKVNAYVGK